MRNAPEVVREVGIDDVRVAAELQLRHLYDCLLDVSLSAVGVDFRRKIGFEDRRQHQRRRCHADPIPHGRDAQRPEFAVGLWYKHSSDWLRPVSLLPERKRQFSQPPLDPIRLAVSEHFSELLGCPISWSLTTSCVRLELRPLPSPGIAQLHRYYGPLRHPSAHGRPVDHPDHTLGLPVLRALSLCTCCRHYPGAAAGHSPRSSHPTVSAFPGRVTGSACTSSFRGLLGVSR